MLILKIMKFLLNLIIRILTKPLTVNVTKKDVKIFIIIIIDEKKDSTSDHPKF